MKLLDWWRAVAVHRRSAKHYGSLQRRTREMLFSGKEIRIETGPFKNIKYIDDFVWGSITPKWLGCYEAELWPIVELILRTRYTVAIDVGCAEGFYAVGLLVRMPDVQMHAYDVDFISRRQVADLCKLNGVSSRLRLGKFCTHSDINAIAQAGRTLLICDIEGGEYALLDAGKCPALQRIDILVEVHSSPELRGSADLLCARFAASHQIQRVEATDRTAWIDAFTSHPEYSNCDRGLLLEAVDEKRSDGRTWLWMRAACNTPTVD